jgi:hypothetical protein
MKIDKKAKPEFIDGMPKEVATALLADPKARRTNAFRKTCQRAREIVYSSSTPLARLPDVVHFVYRDQQLYTTQPMELGDEMKPLKDKTFSQLVRWHTRSVRRRIRALKIAKHLQEKCGKLTGRAGVQVQKRIAIFERQASTLQLAAETLLEEINNRTHEKN